ncbi:hypothetical protein HK405_011279, partial [Cladochytrium tenue]
MVTSTDATQTAISASPTTGAEDSSGSSTILSGTYIGVIAGVGSFLVLVAVLSVFVIRERRKSESEAAEIAAKIDRGEWGLNLDQDPVGQEQARMLEEAQRAAAAAAAAALAREKAAAAAAEAAAGTTGSASSTSSLAGNWVGRWGSQSGPSPLRQTRAVPRAGGGGGGRVLKSALKKRTSAELQAERERERLREMREQIRMSDDEGGRKTPPPPLQSTSDVGGGATKTEAATVAAAAESAPSGSPRPGADCSGDRGNAPAGGTADIISANNGGGGSE